VEFLIQYGLFLAETVTIVLAIIAILIVAIGMSRREASDANLEITHLNTHYEVLSETLEQAMLSKDELKAKAKTRKAADKLKAKAAKRERKTGESNAQDTRARLYVLDFEGDLKASGVDALGEEITAVLTLASPQDEVLIRIDNGGGVVHGHGLAASQLTRLTDQDIPLTVSIDKVAASGGYMMACVADKIVAAPFAIVGSIGVLAQIPNFHRLLDRAGVDFEMVKAGEHKRSLTFFGENTDEDREKMQSDVEGVHELFKRFVCEQRPSLDINAVATGEHWYGTEALDKGLIDVLGTSDDYLMKAAKERDIYTIHLAEKKPLSERLATMVSLSVEKIWERLLIRTQ
jgi:serine protease SohB